MTEPERHSWQLGATAEDPPLEGDIFLPASGGQPTPLVIFSTDLLLPMGWAFYPFIGSNVGRSYPFLAFNPSSSGFVGTGNLIAAPERFQEYTIGSELRDIDRVIAAIREDQLPGAAAIDTNRIIMAGHGKGAALGLLYAARNPEVKGLLCMSAISTLLRFPTEVRQEIKANGFLEVETPLAGEKVKLSQKFLAELEDDPNGFSLQAAIKNLPQPVVFMHGEEDLEVSVKESESLYHWSRKEQTRLVLMEKVGHTFGADHPFKHSNKELDRVIEIFESFIPSVL